MPEAAEHQSEAHISQPAVQTIVYGKGVNPDIGMDTQEAAQTLHDRGVSELGISDTTIYMDPKNRFLRFGTHYPNRLGRLRFTSIPEIQQAKGDVIRLTTVMQGKARTPEQINETFVHEGEHRAQQERKDRKITEGNIAIYGLALTGAIIGNRLGNNNLTRTAGTLLGFTLGNSVGYMVAPHERQARERTRQVKSSAVYKK